MKKCPKCAEEIQDQATVCKHCGHKMPKPNWGCAVVLVFALLVIGMSQVGSDKAEPAKKTPPCEDRSTAFYIAQGFIKDRLKAPATADFPFLSSSDVQSNPIKLPDGRCAFVVSTPVDAENSFGAKIRSRYTVTVAPDLKTNDSWRLVNFEGE